VAVDPQHIYWANFFSEASRDSIGRANLDGSNVDQFFILLGVNSGPCGVAVDHAFSLLKPKRHKKKGTATLPVDVPGPGTLKLKSNGIRRETKDVIGFGEAKLAVKSKGKKKRLLRREGKAKVRAHVTFTPASGGHEAASEKIKLVKR
jgi:hypothetical protein